MSKDRCCVTRVLKKRSRLQFIKPSNILQNLLNLKLRTVIEQYRSYYSHFYSVKIDFTTQGFLQSNNEKFHLYSYLVESFVIFFFGCLFSSHIALQEFVNRHSTVHGSWYFAQMNLTNLVIIILIGFSGLTQIVLFQVFEGSAQEIVTGFNALKLFTHVLSESMYYTKHKYMLVNLIKYSLKNILFFFRVSSRILLYFKGCIL